MKSVLLSMTVFALVVVNVLVTVRTLRGPGWHRIKVIAGIWLLPLVGALLAFINIQPRQISPYSGCTPMRIKRIAAVVLKVAGIVLAFPSAAILFFGAISLRALPWFPTPEQIFGWTAGCGLALLVGAALLKQGAIFANAATSTHGPRLESRADASLPNKSVERTPDGTVHLKR
jgi:hypothetical protein